jgi:predicted component of type VI protein secretion system
MFVRLIVLNGKSAGRELKVTSDEFVVGRSEECQLRPKSDSISRRHCVIRLRDGNAFVEDLQSKNGTYLDGEKIAGERQLTSGCMLRIGRLECQVLFDDPAEMPLDKSGGEQIAEESWADDTDITKWLEEGAANLGSKVDPETRQFRLDESERAALETTSINQASSPTVVQQPNSEEPAAKPEKKKPIKLPPRNMASGATSREAAADMLKKFFNRP